MEKIFENSKFGDKFFTKSGELLIFIRKNKFDALLIAECRGGYIEKTYELNGHYYKDEETQDDIKD